MLLDLPRQRLELLKTLGRKYRLFLLSNTNEIHFKHFLEIVKRTCDMNNPLTSPLPPSKGESFIKGDGLSAYFEKEYYSHLIGMRKPDIRIFEFVLQQNNLKPQETLFIDDSPQHIEGAKHAGLQTYHLKEGETLEINVLKSFS